MAQDSVCVCNYVSCPCALYSVILFCSEWKREEGMCKGIAARGAAAVDRQLVLGFSCDLEVHF